MDRKELKKNGYKRKDMVLVIEKDGKGRPKYSVVNTMEEAKKYSASDSEKRIIPVFQPNYHFHWEYR